MNRYRKIVTVTAILALCLLCLFPPKYVKRTYYDRYYYSNIGHYPLFAQPNYWDEARVYSCRVDKERFAIEALAIVLLTAGFFILGPSNKEKSK